MNDIIWAANGCGLGDCWGSVNYVLNQSIKNNRKEYMSNYFRKGEKKKVYYNKANEILSVLDTDGKIEFVDSDPTYKLSWREIYKVDYASTKIVWNKNKSNKVCYQFDGKSHKCKNMGSKEEEEKILNCLEDKGFSIVKVGGRQSLQNCINELSSCEFFIGVESGFGHISRSVGVPIFMIVNGRTYQGIKDSHENRELLLCEDYIEAIKAIEGYSKDNNYYDNNKVFIK